MAFQKGFYGVTYAPENTSSKQLISALGTLNKSLQKYGSYVGEEQDKKVMAAAEKAARVDNFKSYQDGVDKGEIENTKSDFYIAHYDNIKGANAGSEYQIKKGIAYQEFWANQTNSDQDDTDGSGYLAWSQQYDKENLDQYKNTSTFFQKSLDKSISAINQQLGSRYAADNSKRIKEKYSLEFVTRNEDLIRNSPSKDLFKTLKTLDQTSQEFRALSKRERSALVVQAFKNVISEKTRLGEIESDYTQAIELAESLRDYKGDNGFSYLVGKDPAEWDQYIEKLKQEQTKHDDNIILLEFGKDIDDLIDRQAEQLWGDMTTTYNNIGGEGADKGNFAIPEYKERAKQILLKAQREGNLDKIQVKIDLDILRDQVKAKYDNIQDLKRELVPFSLDMNNKFNIRKNKTKIYNTLSKLRKLTTEKTQTSEGIKTFTYQQALENMADDENYASDIRFIMASAEVNGYVNEDGKVTLKNLKEWWTDYNKYSKQQLEPAYQLIPKEDDE